MRYLIIGLGIYGSNLARDLVDMGHEVIGADVKENVVQSLKDVLTTVYHVDSTEPTALSALPFKNVDLVLVTIGENFGASVKTVALLKQYGAPHIYARAIDPLHQAILEGFKVDRILLPEQHAASDLAREMMLGTDVVTMDVADGVFVVKFTVSEYMVGKRYASIYSGIEKTRLVAVTRCTEHYGLLHVKTHTQELVDTDSEDLTVQSGDQVVLLTTPSALKQMKLRTS